MFEAVILLIAIAGDPSSSKPASQASVAVPAKTEADHAAHLAKLRALISRPARPILHGMAPLDERQTKLASEAIEHYKATLKKLRDGSADNATIRRNLAKSTTDAIAKRNRELRAIMPEIRRSTFDKFIAQEESGLSLGLGLYQSFYLDQRSETEYSFTITNRGEETFHDMTFFVTFIDATGKEVRGGWSGAKVIAPGQTVEVTLSAPRGMVDFILEAGFKSVDQTMANPTLP